MVRTFCKVLGTAIALTLLSLVPATANISNGMPTPSPEARAKGVKYGQGAPMGWERAGARASQTASPRLMIAASTSHQYGIDVSNYQPSVNWAAFARKGDRFAFIKATEGTYYKSPTFNAQYSGATSAHLIRGAYHFAVPNSSSGAGQADYFVRNGGGWSADKKTLPGVLDIEYNPYASSDGTNSCYGMSTGGMVDWIKAFNSEYLSDTGVYPIIYSTADWWRTCTGDSSAFSNTNPFWLAEYNGSTTSGPTSLPAGVSTWTFWQYGDGTPPYSFCGTNYDCDQFNGSLTQLAKVATSSFLRTPTSIGVGAVSGAQQIYLVTAAGNLFTEWQTSAGGHWTSWQDWGNGYTPGTSIGVGQVAGAQQIYLVNGAGHLMTQWQTSPGGHWNTWQDWGSGYAPGTPVSVGHAPDGTQQIYLVNASGHLMTQWQTSPGGSWTAWQDWGSGYSAATPVGVGVAANGAQQLYLVDASGHLMTRWQLSPGGDWSITRDWGSGYTPKTPIGVGTAANGAQEIYMVDSAGHLMTMWQTSPSGLWSAWQDWGGGYAPATPIGVGGSGGLQQIYVVTSAPSHLATKWQTSPNGSWTPLQPWGN